MSDTKLRKTHSAQFKAKVGLEAVRGLKTINELGVQYDVHPKMVGQWKKEIVDRVATVFEGKRGPRPADNTDKERLFSEIGRLKMELDWLKNKSGLSSEPRA